MFNLIDEDISEDEEKILALNDVKKRTRRQFGPETTKNSIFYTQEIVKADDCINKTSTGSIIWNPDTILGVASRIRFRVPCEISIAYLGTIPVKLIPGNIVT